MDYLEHITSDGERWDSIAQAKYGDVSKVDILINDNKHIPIAPTIAGGIKMLIRIIEPTDSQSEVNRLPPWKR